MSTLSFRPAFPPGTDALRFLAVLTLLAVPGSAADSEKPLRWRIQYFHDKDDVTFVIRDLRFSSASRGIGVGELIDKKGKSEPLSVITRDGGATWTEVPLPDTPASLFLLNDSIGWMAGEKGLWRTDEGGRSWTRIKGMRGLRRVHFVDEKRGWASGWPKLFMETRDGGRTWTQVAGVKEIPAKSEDTYFDWIEFVNPKQAIVLGANVAKRHATGSWMEPSTLALSREWPSLAVALESNDGGETWKPQTVPIFGRYHRFRSSVFSSVSVALIRFVHTFQFPSEVYLIDKGKTTSIFKKPNLKVTDLGWLGKSVMLAAVEPPGKLHQLPIPGSLHVLASVDLKNWTEIPVDYRAFGNEVVMATAGADAWIATDTGQILKLGR